MLNIRRLQDYSLTQMGQKQKESSADNGSHSALLGRNPSTGLNSPAHGLPCPS